MFIGRNEKITFAKTGDELMKNINGDTVDIKDLAIDKRKEKIRPENPRGLFRGGFPVRLSKNSAKAHFEQSSGGARGGKARLESDKPPQKDLIFKSFGRSGILNDFKMLGGRRRQKSPQGLF